MFLFLFAPAWQGKNKNKKLFSTPLFAAPTPPPGCTSFPLVGPTVLIWAGAGWVYCAPIITIEQLSALFHVASHCVSVHCIPFWNLLVWNCFPHNSVLSPLEGGNKHLAHHFAKLSLTFAFCALTMLALVYHLWTSSSLKSVRGDQLRCLIRTPAWGNHKLK